MMGAVFIVRASPITPSSTFMNLNWRNWFLSYIIISWASKIKFLVSIYKLIKCLSIFICLVTLSFNKYIVVRSSPSWNNFSISSLTKDSYMQLFSKFVSLRFHRFASLLWISSIILWLCNFLVFLDWLRCILEHSQGKKSKISLTMVDWLKCILEHSRGNKSKIFSNHDGLIEKNSGTL